MAIDVLKDKLLTPAELAALCPARSGKKVCAFTVLRWMLNGLKVPSDPNSVVRLESVLYGENRMSTEKELREFFQRRTEADQQARRRAAGGAAEAHARARPKRRSPAREARIAAASARVRRPIGSAR